MKKHPGSRDAFSVTAGKCGYWGSALEITHFENERNKIKILLRSRWVCAIIIYMERLTRLAMLLADSSCLFCIHSIQNYRPGLFL